MNIKPLIYGSFLFSLLQGVFLSSIALGVNLPSVVIWAPYLTMFICGLVTGHLAKSRIWLSLMFLGFSMAIIMGILNFLWHTVGFSSDFPGVVGSLHLTILSIPYALILSIIGGALGSLIDKRSYLLTKP
ncbi:MAG: hypothetical protein DRQ47_08050 [Gammaproteobacteria bacterium]|nr:MAG: hypothetical protein DRQ47_08050 [Gammaproteobacteria bacterium]